MNISQKNLNLKNLKSKIFCLKVLTYLMTNSRPHITRNSTTNVMMNTSNITKSETYRRQCKIKDNEVTQWLNN